MPTATLLNLPIVVGPRAEAGRSTICTQKSVQLHVTTEAQKRVTKMCLRFYWGSNPWRLGYARRTYVEGWFGVLKNTTATGFHCGSYQFKGASSCEHRLGDGSPNDEFAFASGLA